MAEGDCAGGVLAHNDFLQLQLCAFVVWESLPVTIWRTGAGRLFSNTVRNFRFYRSASSRIERMTNRLASFDFPVEICLRFAWFSWLGCRRAILSALVAELFCVGFHPGGIGYFSAAP